MLMDTDPADPSFRPPPPSWPAGLPVQYPATKVTVRLDGQQVFVVPPLPGSMTYLAVTPQAWARFVAGVKEGRFDDLG
jgi:hypothetical protein